jgi:biopolymer transport protein ExbD
MKVREIILDFTSLLDVIMIILFFFILFSTFEIETATNEANQTKIEYEAKSEEAEKERKKYEVERDKLLNLDKNAVKNQEALSAYNDNQVLSINLVEKIDSEGLYINILRGDDKLLEIKYESSLNYNKEITDIIESSNYKSDDVIICNLIYNGDNIGSAEAVEKIEKAVNNVQNEYKNFYFAAINISK